MKKNIKSNKFIKIKEFPLYNYTKDKWPLIRTDEKDTLVFHKTKDFIDVYNADDFTLIKQIPAESVQFFFLSPKTANLQICLTIPEVNLIFL